MKIRLPQRKNIKDSHQGDPLKFYYFPVVRSFYKARLADAARLLGGHVSRLLEVGCGSGIFLPELAGHCDSLFACDIHDNICFVKDMLIAEKVDVELVHADACSLPYDSESMDGIVCMSVLEHLHDLKTPVDEFYRILRPGGIAIIGVPVTNLISTVMLKTACFFGCPDTRIENEHVSSDSDIHNVLTERFIVEDVLNIPRFIPRAFRMYCTMRFLKS